MENLVGYVRRNALMPVPDLPSWAALAAQLADWCERERRRRQDAWVQEQAGLRPLPDRPFRCALIRLCPVNRFTRPNFHFTRSRFTC